jgi:hypothetical protein
MNTNAPIVKWQKWSDPFGLEDEAKWTDYENNIIDIEKIKKDYISKLNKPDDNLYEDEYDDEYDDQITHIQNVDNKPVKVIASPMGLIPYNEHTASSKIFNFWVGHTNFTITKAVVDIIENTDGVEILDIFTRYRFRIAIGKCFNDGETMDRINKNLYSFLENEDVSKK